MRCVAQGVALAVFLGVSQSARSDVIFDNFGDGDRYQLDVGWEIGGAPGEDFYEQGDPFFVVGNYTLTQITLASSYVQGPNVYTVWLMDDAGGVPGNIIEEFDFTNLGDFSDNNPPLVAASALNPTLEDGQVYWLVASTSDSTVAAWNFNNTGDTGAHAQRVNGGDWSIINYTHGAFRIEGDLMDSSPSQSRGAARPVVRPATPVDPASIIVVP